MGGKQATGFGRQLAARLAADRQLSPLPPPRRAATISPPGSRSVGRPPSSGTATPPPVATAPPSPAARAAIPDQPVGSRRVSSPAVLASVLAAVTVMGAIVWCTLRRFEEATVRSVPRLGQMQPIGKGPHDDDLPYIGACLMLPAGNGIELTVEDAQPVAHDRGRIVLGAPLGHEWSAETDAGRADRR